MKLFLCQNYQKQTADRSHKNVSTKKVHITLSQSIVRSNLTLKFTANKSLFLMIKQSSDTILESAMRNDIAIQFNSIHSMHILNQINYCYFDS